MAFKNSTGKAHRMRSVLEVKKIIASCYQRPLGRSGGFESWHLIEMKVFLLAVWELLDADAGFWVLE